MTQISQLVTIADYPKEPLTLFQSLLSRLDAKLILMNLATVDNEFGVLNRTIVYRGLLDSNVVFVTERNSRKYQNLKENPKLGLSFFFPEVPANSSDASGCAEIWQVRLMDAVAVELNEQQISKYWAEESVYAKIRSHICECGKPGERAQLQQRHDQLLQDYESDRNQLEQTKTYTVFQVRAKRWDFYKSGENAIADRVQYCKLESDAGDAPESWRVYHVEP